LRAISRCGREVCFEIFGGREEEGVWVRGEEEAEVEGVGGGFLDCHWELAWSF